MEWKDKKLKRIHTVTGRIIGRGDRQCRQRVKDIPRESHVVAL